MEERLLDPREDGLVARGHAQGRPTGVARIHDALVPGALLLGQHGAHELGLPVGELVVGKGRPRRRPHAAALLRAVLELRGAHEHVGQDVRELLHLRAQRDLGELARELVGHALAARAGHVGALQGVAERAGAGAHRRLEHTPHGLRQHLQRGVELQRRAHEPARDVVRRDLGERAHPAGKRLEAEQRGGVGELRQEGEQVVRLGKLAHHGVERGHEVRVGGRGVRARRGGDVGPLRGRGAGAHHRQGRKLPGHVGRVGQQADALGSEGLQGPQGRQALKRGGVCGRRGRLGGRGGRLGQVAHGRLAALAAAVAPHAAPPEELRQARCVVALQLVGVALARKQPLEDARRNGSESGLRLRRAHADAQLGKGLARHALPAGHALVQAGRPQREEEDAQVHLRVPLAGVEHVGQGVRLLGDVARHHGAALRAHQHGRARGEHLVAAAQVGAGALHAHGLVGAARLVGNPRPLAPAHEALERDRLAGRGRGDDAREGLVALGHELGGQGRKPARLGLVVVHHRHERVARGAAGPGDARGEQRDLGYLAQLRGARHLVGHLRRVRDDLVDIVGVGRVEGHERMHRPPEGEAPLLLARHDVAQARHDLPVGRHKHGALRLDEPVVDAERLAVVRVVGERPLAGHALGHRELALSLLGRAAHLGEPHHLQRHATALPFRRKRLAPSRFNGGHDTRTRPRLCQQRAHGRAAAHLACQVPKLARRPYPARRKDVPWPRKSSKP